MSKLTDKILKEAAASIVMGHYDERVTDRFLKAKTVNVGVEIGRGEYKIVGTYEFPDAVKYRIKDMMWKIETTDFPKNASCAIKIADLNIDRSKVKWNSITAANESQKYTLVVVDEKTNSNGDVIYAIIRNNRVTTIYFGKSYVPQTPQKLRVDKVIG